MAASGPGHAGAVPEPVQALTSPEVKVELLDGAVLLVTLQRPRKLNAVTPSMLATLAKAMAWPGTTAGAGATAVVLTGSAGNFTSGADVSGSSPSSEVGLDRAPVADFMHAMIDCVVPIIAAIEGAAVGIGCTLVPHCDIVVASKTAYFQTPFMRNAVVPEFAATQLFAGALGRATAHDLLYTGRKLAADEALRLGFISRVTAPGAALEQALGLALALAHTPLGTKSARMFRSMLQGERREALHRVVTWELQLLQKRLDEGDVAEAVMAWWAARSEGKL